MPRTTPVFGQGSHFWRYVERFVVRVAVRLKCTDADAVLCCPQILFPMIIVEFSSSSSANFGLFRATVVGEWWWDVRCRQWGFTDSAINLVYRVNKVNGPTCNVGTAFISFGNDFSVSTHSPFRRSPPSSLCEESDAILELPIPCPQSGVPFVSSIDRGNSRCTVVTCTGTQYEWTPIRHLHSVQTFAWYLDVYAVLVFLLLGVGVGMLWGSIFITKSSDTVIDVVKLVHFLAAVVSIALVSVTFHTADQLKYVCAPPVPLPAYTCTRSSHSISQFLYITNSSSENPYPNPISLTRHEGTNSQTVITGAGFYGLVFMPYMALVSMYKCMCADTNAEDCDGVHPSRTLIGLQIRDVRTLSRWSHSHRCVCLCSCLILPVFCWTRKTGRQSGRRRIVKRVVGGHGTPFLGWSNGRNQHRVGLRRLCVGLVRQVHVVPVRQKGVETVQCHDPMKTVDRGTPGVKQWACRNHVFHKQHVHNKR